MSSPGSEIQNTSQPLAPAIPQPKPKSIVFVTPFIPVMLLLLVIAGFVVNRAYLALPYPFQLDSEEGFLLNQALLLSKGKTIYKPLNDYPYVVGNYGPMYPLINAIPLLVFEPSLFYGRFINFLSFLGILVLMVRLVEREGQQRIFSLCAPLLFIATYDLYEWIAYARVDLFGIFLSVCGLALVAQGAGRGSRIWAMVFLALGIYTKQTLVAAPIACVVYLVLKERMRGVRFGLALVLVVLAIFTILNVATRGEFFKHTVVYNTNVFDIWQLKRWVVHLLRFNVFYLSAISIAVVYYLVTLGRGRSLSSRDLFALYFVVASVSILGIAKKGSAPNYLLEPHIAFSLFFCTQAAGLASAVRQGAARAGEYLTYGLITVLMLCHCVNLYCWMPALRSPHNPDKSDYQKGNLATLYFLSEGDETLSELPIFNILTEKPVLFQPFIMAQLAHEGKWDESPVLADIRRQRFSVILTTQDLTREGDFFFRYTEGFVKAVNRYYQLDYKLDFGRGLKYYLYVPKNTIAPVQRSVAFTAFRAG